MVSRWLFLVLLALSIWGCGGGGGGTGNGGGGGGDVPTVSDAKFQIAWPARSRDGLAHGLTSALSAKLMFEQGSASGADITQVVARDATKPEAHTETYTLPTPIRKSVTTLRATFYATADASGAAVGTAVVAVDYRSGSAVLGSVTLVGKVNSVTVVDPGMLVVGSAPTQLSAIAKDPDGATLAVTPGSISWRVAGGSGVSLTADGLATATDAGTTNVIATVDGVDSARFAVASRDQNLAYFSVTWPARSRALAHSLTSALSLSVILEAAGTSDLARAVVNRNSDPAEHTETYSVDLGHVEPVNFLGGTFFSDYDGKGDMVGTVSGSVTQTGNQLEIGTITLSGKVERVKVITVPSLIVGEAGVQLHAEVRDAGNKLLAVTPGSIRWNVVSGSEFLSVSPDGLATGIGSGSAAVTATVDGKVSPNASIVVYGSGNPITTQNLNRAITDLCYNEATGKVWLALAPSDATDPNCVVSIDPATGSVVDKYTVGGQLGQIAVADDGSFAYVTVGNNKVQRLDLAVKTLGPTFTVDSGTFLDLKVLPQQADSYGLLTLGTEPRLSMWAGATKKANTALGGTYFEFVYFKPNPTITIRQAIGDTNGYLTIYAADIAGFGYRSNFPTPGAGAVVAGNLLYMASGSVLNLQTNLEQMAFPPNHFQTNRALAVSSLDNRAYFATWETGTTKRFVTFDRTSGVEQPLSSTTGIPGTIDHLEACGTHTLICQVTSPTGTKGAYFVRGLP